jgi:hypothetical protein
MTKYKGYITVETNSSKTLYGHLSDSDAGDLAYFSNDEDEINHACLGQILNLYKTNER